MGILLADMEEVSLQRIKDSLSALLNQLLEDKGGQSGNIIRLEILCPDIDCLGWLKAQSSEYKIYWSGRDDELETAGIGIADLLKDNEIISNDKSARYEEILIKLRKNLSAGHEYLRYYGGFSFNNKKPDKQWRSFGSCLFIMPRFEIVRVKGKTFFAVNIKTDEVIPLKIKEIISNLNALIFMGKSLNDNLPGAESLRHLPDRENWDEIFNKTIRTSGKMVFDKIVLARKTLIDFKNDIDPLVLLTKLKENTAGCFHFYFQPSINNAFLGATPERLFKRKGLNVESEAIAGTKPLGKNESEDCLLEKELSGSIKDNLEHKFVVDLIRNTLNKLCSALKFDKSFSIIKVSTVQHMITRFQGTLRKDISDAKILSALHPTPAVGGCPLNKALSAISKIEPFSRGWYCGPVGIIGYDYVDLAVALRCALVHDNNVSLFAGAGIVEGSTSEAEWQEIENKNSVYMRIFGRL